MIVNTVAAGVVVIGGYAAISHLCIVCSACSSQGRRCNRTASSGWLRRGSNAVRRANSTRCYLVVLGVSRKCAIKRVRFCADHP